MNYQVDIIIVGDSNRGHEVLDKLALSKPTIKLAFISKEFKSYTTYNYLNVKYLKNEVVFTDYKNRLFCCYLRDGIRIYGTHLIIASGLSYKPFTLNDKVIPQTFNDIDDIPKIAKNLPAVVIGNKNSDVKFALDVAKKYKQVYLCSKDITINNITPANIKKLANTKNIALVPNTSIIKAVVQDGVLQKIELDNYSTLNCSAIYIKTDAEPATSFVSEKLIEKDSFGYLIVNENAESTLVPKCFAVGSCIQKYTKAMLQKLTEVILNDF